jgi:hypothetical protein
MDFDVYPNDSDEITEQRETRGRARSNSSDYVERGMGVTLNGDGTFDVNNGMAVVRDGTQAWEVEDSAGAAGLSLDDAGGTNYIYVTFDPTASDVEGSATYVAKDSQSPPSDPSLLISIADASTGSVTPQNDAPAGEFESLDTEDADVNLLSIGSVAGVLEWSDGGGNQSIPNATETKILWQSEADEDSDFVSVDPNNDEMTVQVDCKVMIGGYVTWAGGFASSGRTSTRVYVNGSQEATMPQDASTQTNFSQVLPPVELSLSSGDTIDTRVYQDSGNSEELLQGAGSSSNFGQWNVRRIA